MQNAVSNAETNTTGTKKAIDWLNGWIFWQRDPAGFSWEHELWLGRSNRTMDFGRTGCSKIAILSTVPVFWGCTSRPGGRWDPDVRWKCNNSQVEFFNDETRASGTSFYFFSDTPKHFSTLKKIKAIGVLGKKIQINENAFWNENFVLFLFYWLHNWVWGDFHLTARKIYMEISPNLVMKKTCPIFEVTLSFSKNSGVNTRSPIDLWFFLTWSSRCLELWKTMEFPWNK